MKKSLTKKMSIISAIILLVVISFTFTACGSHILTINENGSFSTAGYDYVKVDVPTNQATYNVTIETAPSTETNKTRLEVIEDIRPTVVDVYSYSNSGQSSGSGVIVGSAVDGNKGYYFIVTNHHVVEGCTSFQVSLLFIDDKTGKESYDNYYATLIGGSPKRDIAVLRIEKKANETIKTAVFVDDSDKVKVGTDVIAIGNPLGILGGTVTMGIVSATAREVSVQDVGSMTLMQTDAAINSGNSGGGLFDENGILVGVVNSGYSSYEGLNFAIPANDAKFATESLISTYDETKAKPYGYVEGDTEIGITCSTMNIYESATSTTQNQYIVAYATNSSSLFYDEWQNYYKALTGIKIDYTDPTKEDVDKKITTYDEFSELMKTIKAGDTITFKHKDVMESGYGPNRKLYLASNESSTTRTVTQYIYTI